MSVVRRPAQAHGTGPAKIDPRSAEEPWRFFDGLERAPTLADLLRLRAVLYSQWALMGQGEAAYLGVERVARDWVGRHGPVRSTYCLYRLDADGLIERLSYPEPESEDGLLDAARWASTVPLDASCLDVLKDNLAGAPSPLPHPDDISF